MKWSRGLRSLFVATIGSITPTKNPSDTDYLKTQLAHLERQLLKYTQERVVKSDEVIPGRIIYREMGSWNTTFWIDKGTHHGLTTNRPVVIGSSLVGVIDEVVENRSKVRLITDPAVSVAVRALRGEQADMELKHHLDSLFETLVNSPKLFESGDERQSVLEHLARLSCRIESRGETLHLAKGEIQGALSPMWRSKGPLLKGRGFNYSHADSHSPARELTSGRVYGERDGEHLSLIEPGDLLVTSGMDGLFPEGLNVARVTEVAQLKEGAVSFELTGRMVAGNIEDIKVVYVLNKV